MLLITVNNKFTSDDKTLPIIFILFNKDKDEQAACLIPDTVAKLRFSKNE